jgi:hypothetical protein
MPGPKYAVDIHADAADLLSVAINISSAGNNTVIFGTAGTLIRIYKIFFIAAGATTITFQDGASTALSGPVSFSTNEGIVLDFDTKPWFQTTLGNDFVMNLGSAVTVAGTAYYTQQA